MKLIQLLVLAHFFVSCSTINKMGIRATGGILNKAGSEFTKESDLEFFELSVPGNLKFMEGLWYNDQSNESLLTNLIKGFGGYGFAVNETKYLEFLLADKKSQHKEQAIVYYSKAMDYGKYYFEENGIEWKTMLQAGVSDKIQKMFDSKFGDDDMTAVFFFAQAWGSLMNLQKDNIEIVSHLGTVKSMMDWVCKRDPDFELGSCDLFYATYEASRPSMLGGNPDNGAQMFRDYIKKYPYNLLARVAYLQFYVIPMMDEELYSEQKEVLNKELVIWEKQKNYGADLYSTSKYHEHKKYNLYNAIAKKRFEIIKKSEKEIF